MVVVNTWVWKLTLARIMTRGVIPDVVDITSSTFTFTSFSVSAAATNAAVAATHLCAIASFPRSHPAPVPAAPPAHSSRATHPAELATSAAATLRPCTR
jgi:hypothetical protein